jgi:hypothetical protein
MASYGLPVSLCFLQYCNNAPKLIQTLLSEYKQWQLDHLKTFTLSRVAGSTPVNIRLLASISICRLLLFHMLRVGPP